MTMVFNRGAMRTGVAGIALSMVLAGCGTTPQHLERPLTPAEQRVRDQANDFNRTVGEGAVLGALLGAAIGAAAGGGKWQNVVAGAGAGAVAGGAGGYYYADKKEGYFNEEERLDAILGDMRADNQKLETLVADARTVITADNATIDQVERDLAAKRISVAQARRRLAAVDDNRAVLEKTITGLKERRDSWRHAADEARRDAGARPKVAEMEGEIRTLETQVSRLERELDQLTTRRRSSVVG
ncbi:MAG: hypothetical protein WAS73_08835 [Defluviicoccus sp.]